MNMTAKIRQVGHVTIVDISCRIVLGEECASLGELVNELLGKGHIRILLNLADILRIDTAGLAGRVVQIPVAESRYASLRAVKGGLAWLREPVAGVLGEGAASPEDDAPRPLLERFDLHKREVTELVAELEVVRDAEASIDGGDDVGGADGVALGTGTDLVARAVDVAGLDASAGEEE